MDLGLAPEPDAGGLGPFGRYHAQLLEHRTRPHLDRTPLAADTHRLPGRGAHWHERAPGPKVIPPPTRHEPPERETQQIARSTSLPFFAPYPRSTSSISAADCTISPRTRTPPGRPVAGDGAKPAFDPFFHSRLLSPSSS